MLVRASIGTLAAIGLLDLKIRVQPGIAYLLQYSETGCLAGCYFCSQSAASRVGKEFLSRVVWPIAVLEEVAPRIAVVFDRVCVQSIIKPGFVEELHDIVRTLSRYDLRVSLSTTPLPDEDLEKFRQEGVDYLGVGLDASSPSVAKEVNKPYTYEEYLDFIKRAIRVFGRGNVVVHIIVGIGENLKDALETVKRVYSLGARVSLFAFTPLRGTRMENWPRPSLRYYRIIQLSNYLISRGVSVEEFVDVYRECVRLNAAPALSDASAALLVSGCPGCNRPYYTESPREEPYNFPSADLLPPIQDVLRRLSCDIS